MSRHEFPPHYSGRKGRCLLPEFVSDCPCFEKGPRLLSDFISDGTVFSHGAHIQISEGLYLYKCLELSVLIKIPPLSVLLDKQEKAYH